MQAQAFIRKWGPGGPAFELNERAGAQSHFIDLCRVLGVAEPDDPERGLTKTGSAAGRTDGFTDNWPTSPYPDRIVARPGFEKDLAGRTLTKLYNQRPAWLAQAHDTRDAAVAAAYGFTDWTSAMADDEILRRLLTLNLERETIAGR